ncbi:MAG TPA: zinc-ribbon domain containing protein [Pyrinomonadaceae bacterium]|nr:zinc-ribbon domain containing protein [Pyrinomonadaceae bacterium]
MSDTRCDEPNPTTNLEAEFTDLEIGCIDCSETFVFTAGEQVFFRDKGLLNPPKRCKDCKKAKTKRIDAIELGRVIGKRQRLDVRAKCAKCDIVTTVPFYPSQGRPVYCRECYSAMSDDRSAGVSNGS